MINLIPPDAKKQVKREYWMRVFTVWTMLLGSAFLISAFILAPAFVLVQSQIQNFEEEYTRANSKGISFQESEAAITEANEIAKLLSRAEKNGEEFTYLIGEIEALSGEGVFIDTYAFSRTGGAVNPITISGQAASRLILTEFKDAIEQSPLFASATLPLSNLAKDKDIPFSITLAISKEE